MPPPLPQQTTITIAIILFLSPPPHATTHRLLPPFAPAGHFARAPEFPNAESCPPPRYCGCITPCDPGHVHIAMTLDPLNLRGTVAAVHSILKHTSCPSLLFFHFISNSSALRPTVLSVFPSLRFRIYTLPAARVDPLVSADVLEGLDYPLSYARIFLADLLESCVSRVLYLDSDVLVLDDVRSLWDATPLPDPTVIIAAAEYCSTNFTRYFKDSFWREEGEWGPEAAFEGSSRQPCYFNAGVMVVDLSGWRSGRYTELIEGWMRRQKHQRISRPGPVPPLLLVFAGDVEPVEHRWNRHGLGGEELFGSCRKAEPGPVSLLHWSGRGKPWNRLDAKRPCKVDWLWDAYDLYVHPTPPPTPPSTSRAWWSPVLVLHYMVGLDGLLLPIRSIQMRLVGRWVVIEIFIS